MTALLLATGTIVGALSRSKAADLYATLFRAQLCLVSVLGLLSGLTFQVNPRSTLALVAILAGEFAAFAVGYWYFRRHPQAPILSYTAGFANVGWWVVPMAAMLIGPKAVVFAILYDLLLSPRALPAITLMRRHAPQRQSEGSAFIDYLPPIAVLAGFIISRFAATPEQVLPLIPTLGIFASIAAFYLLGLSLPRSLPSRDEFKLAGRVVLISMTVLPATLIAMTLLGAPVHKVAWLLAFSPAPFALHAKAYGYNARLGTAITMVSLAAAIAALPLALFLASPAGPFR